MRRGRIICSQLATAVLTPASCIQQFFHMWSNRLSWIQSRASHCTGVSQYFSTYARLGRQEISRPVLSSQETGQRTNLQYITTAVASGAPNAPGKSSQKKTSLPLTSPRKEDENAMNVNEQKDESLKKRTAAAAVSASEESEASNDAGKKKTKKKKLNYNPTWSTIISAIKEKDAEKAWNVYSEDKKTNTYSLYQLQALGNLFLGKEDWVEQILNLNATATAGSAQKTWAATIIEEMDKLPAEKDEVYYCMKARLCALREDPPGALAAAYQCSAAPKAAVRLRTYLPALVAYAKAGNVSGALETFKAIQQEGESVVDMADEEYRYVVYALAEHGTLEQMEEIWLKMQEDISEIGPVTESLIRKFFARLCEVENSDKFWQMSTVEVDPKGDGYVEQAQGYLGQAKLSPEDWCKFADSVRKLANKREVKSGHFEQFVNYLSRRNADIFIDAANVAHYNTMWLIDNEKPNARFQWLQVKAVYDAVKEAYPGRGIMVIVSGARCQGDNVHSKQDQAFLDELQKGRNLYVTPKGSNDDWYWLYGTISRGCNGLLVSNDKLRDHIFDLLRPRFFLKWRNNQKCMYEVLMKKDRSVEASLIPPPRFTTCIQKVQETGAWMFPLGDNRWLCAHRDANVQR